MLVTSTSKAFMPSGADFTGMRLDEILNNTKFLFSSAYRAHPMPDLLGFTSAEFQHCPIFHEDTLLPTAYDNAQE